MIDTQGSEINERYDLNIRPISSPEFRYEDQMLYLVDNDIELNEEIIYNIRYLKNSRIIVEIQEIK